MPPLKTSDWSRLYWELAQIGVRTVGEKRRWAYSFETKTALLTFALACSRSDPRLLGALTDYVFSHWRDLDAVGLRSGYYHQLDTPQILAVIAEFVKGASQEREAIVLMEYLQADLAPVPFQLFFTGLYPPGSAFAVREASESLLEYKKWGFLARERPMLYGNDRQTLGTLPSRARLQILERLARQAGSVSMGTYLSAIHHSVSRQQAYHDLRHASFLVPLGKGRGSHWVLAS